MRMISNFSDLIEKSSQNNKNSNILFYIVYINEGHPNNGKWKLKNNYKNIVIHKTLQDRINAVKEFENEWKNILLQLKISVNSDDDKNNVKSMIIIDNMNNELESTFGAYNERLYIVKNNKIVMKGGVGPMFYNLNQVKKYLQKHVKQIKI